MRALISKIFLASIILSSISCEKNFEHSGDDNSLKNQNDGPLTFSVKNRTLSNNSIYGTVLFNFSITDPNTDADSHLISLIDRRSGREVTHRTKASKVSIPLSLLLSNCGIFALRIYSLDAQGRSLDAVAKSINDVCSYSSIDVQVTFEQGSLARSASSNALTYGDDTDNQYVSTFLADYNIGQIYTLDPNLNYTVTSSVSSVYVEDMINMTGNTITDNGDNDFNDFSYTYASILATSQTNGLGELSLKKAIFPFISGAIDALYSSKVGFFIHFSKKDNTEFDAATIAQISFSEDIEQEQLISTSVNIKEEFLRDKEEFLLKVELDNYKDACFNNRLNKGSTRKDLFFECKTPFVWELDFEGSSTSLNDFNIKKITPFVYVKNTDILLFSEGAIKNNNFLSQDNLKYNTLMEFIELDPLLDLSVTGKKIDDRYPGYRIWRDSNGEDAKNWFSPDYGKNEVDSGYEPPEHEGGSVFSPNIAIIESKNLVDKGNWDSSLSYIKNDKVNFCGVDYVATSETSEGDMPDNPWGPIPLFVLGTKYESEGVHVIYDSELYRTGWYSSGSENPKAVWDQCVADSPWWDGQSDLSCEWKLAATPDEWSNNTETNTGDIVSKDGVFYQKKLDCPNPISPALEASENWAIAPIDGTVYYNGITISNELFERIQIASPLREEITINLDDPSDPNNPENVRRVMSLVSQEQFDYMFPVRYPVYTYEGLIKAISKFPSFCGNRVNGNAEEICKRELATVFAHNNQETGAHSETGDDITDLDGNLIFDNGNPIEEWRQAFYHLNEFCGDRTGNLCGSYRGSECEVTQWQGIKYPCPPGVKYYGRGAKQLSYNYNYGYFSKIFFGDASILLNNPERVAEEPELAISSAIWFYMTPQLPKPSMHEVNTGMWQPTSTDITEGRVSGFGITTMIINGGVECGGSEEIAQSKNRIKYFKAFSNYLNFSIPDNEVLGCANMMAFGSDGVKTPYISPDLDNCQSQTSYSTPYNLFDPDDVTACFERRYEVTK